MKFFVMIIILLLFFNPWDAFGEDQSLGEVTVRAPSDDAGDETGRGLAPEDSVMFATTIPKKSLEGRKTSLPEVLQEASGIQLRRYGGLDDFATISIRGSTSEQVTVYLNGVLLNQGQGGGVNIATIPTDQIEKIEIYKGAAPASFGTSSIGGIVHITTKKPEKKRRTKITQSYGSFQTYEGSLLHSEHRGIFSGEMGYSFNYSSGNFSFLNNNGTPFNSTDDLVEKRKNNAFARHNVLTDISLSPLLNEGLSLHFHNQFLREDRGIPGLATLTSETADLSTTRNSTSFDIEKRNLFPHFNLTLSPFFLFLKEQFTDVQGEIGLGAEDNDNTTFHYGSLLKGNLIVGTHQRWGVYLQYRGEQFLPRDFTQTPSTLPSSVRNHVSVSVEDEISLLNEKIVLNPSLRTEHIFNNFSGVSSSNLHPLSAKIGVRYLPQERIALRTNFSRSFRVPNFSELFGDRGSLIGNPDLRPEEGLNWDIGGSLDLKPFRLETSYFLNHVDQLIQFLQTSQFTVRAENIASARIQGVEVILGASFLNHLETSANYTLQWAKNTSGLPGTGGKLLPGRPLHEFNTRLSLYNSWGKIFSNLNFVDGNFLDTQNIQKISHRIFWNAGVSAKFLKHFQASMEVKNLLNELTADVAGFPLPGRSVYGKVEIQL